VRLDLIKEEEVMKMAEEIELKYHRRELQTLEKQKSKSLLTKNKESHFKRKKSSTASINIRKSNPYHSISVDTDARASLSILKMPKLEESRNWEFKTLD
jgi:hypothetical protein